MSDAVLIERFSERELRELLRDVVQSETEGLRKEVALLREQLRERRAVITPREATHYFDSNVTPATIIDYIWYRGLPAFKNGRIWFIYLADLFDWQIGLIGHPSTKKLGIKKIAAPRHHQKRSQKHRVVQDPLSRQAGEERSPTVVLKSGKLEKTSPEASPA